MMTSNCGRIKKKYIFVQNSGMNIAETEMWKHEKCLEMILTVRMLKFRYNSHQIRNNLEQCEANDLGFDTSHHCLLIKKKNLGREKKTKKKNERVS